MILISWLARLAERRECFHHERVSGGGLPPEAAVSWIRSELIDLGRRKRFWCIRCRRQWFTP